MAIERIIMAEGGTPTEAAGPVQATGEPNVVVAPEIKGGVLNRWLRRGPQPQVLVKPGEQASQTRPVTPTTEQILKIPIKERISYLRALPESEQTEAIKVLKLEIVGGAADPDWLKASPSRFQEAKRLGELLPKVDRDQLDNAQKTDYDQRVNANNGEMTTLMTNMETNGVLRPLYRDLRIMYRQATTNPISRWGDEAGGSRAERLEAMRTRLLNYPETFWDLKDPALDPLKKEYEGAAGHVASLVAVAMYKDLEGIPLSPTTELGDRILAAIKQERQTERTRERQRATAEERLGYSEWRERYDFTWAETPQELKETVFDWLEQFRVELPKEAPERKNQSVEDFRRNARSALRVAENRLNKSPDKSLRIPIGSPLDLELRATIEAYVDAIGGVELLESGEDGFEVYTAYLEDFGYNFNAHHDAIYLRKKSAIIQAFLNRNDNPISLGTPPTIEKPQEGDFKDFRGRIEERAKEYAATHDLYIREEDFARRRVESNNGYGWDDVIEELLLVDNRGMAAANALTGPVAQAEAVAKVATRIAVFKNIKERLDEEDKLAGLNPDQRKEVIRTRIRAKMVEDGKSHLATRIDAITDLTAKDQRLWEWLRRFNEAKELKGQELWFPSAWDLVRLSINRPEKLVDRALSQDELEAMIEVVGPYRTEIRDMDVAINTDGLTEEEIKVGIDGLPNLNETEKQELFEDALFDQQKRATEAERAFNINRTYQKFLGPDARWGGMVARVVDENGETVLKPISAMARDILKAKIDKEEADIEVKVTAFEPEVTAKISARVNIAGQLQSLEQQLTAQGLPQTEIDQRKTELDQQLQANIQDRVEAAKLHKRRLLRRDATFGATLGLREIGIAHNLPIWNYFYYNDRQRIQTFAPLVGYTHGHKRQIVELLDRGRREMRAVFDYLADQYMDGTILVVQDNPDIDLHEESWDRARVINEAGEVAQRQVFDSRFEQSTSGGVKVVPLISKIGDLGIYDLLWEMGCEDFREFQGFIKRRDEWELRRQSFWNITKWADPISYAKRLRGARAALPYLRGGEVRGQGRKPGTVQEPLMGSYKARDQLYDPNIWMDDTIRSQISLAPADFRAKIQEVINKVDNVKHIDPKSRDRLVEIGYEILVTVREYMDARRYVMNRAGFAPKNWEADNELIFKAWIEEVLKRSPLIAEAGEILDNGKVAKGGELKQPAILGGAEKLGDEHMGYAVPGRSPLAIKIYSDILRTSTYHLLEEADRKALAKRAKEVKTDFDAKRSDILIEILPQAEKARVKAKVDALRKQEKQPNETELEKRIRVEAQISRLTNQALTTELHNQLASGNPISLAQDKDTEIIQRKINARIIKLAALHTKSENVTTEIMRMTNQYIDEKLHKQFVGEWPARFAGIQ